MPKYNVGKSSIEALGLGPFQPGHPALCLSVPAPGGRDTCLRLCYRLKLLGSV